MYGEYGDDDVRGGDWYTYGGSGDCKGRGGDLCMIGRSRCGDGTKGGD